MNLDRIAPLLGLLVTTALLQAGVGAAAPTETDQCLQAGDTPVHMKTRDGVTIYGLEVGTGTTGVVLGHQYFSDHCEFMALARELAGLGYRAVSIDFRGNGLSSTGRSNRLDLDIAASGGEAPGRRRHAGEARRRIDGRDGCARRRLVDPASRGRDRQPFGAVLLPRPRRSPRGPALECPGSLPRLARRPAVRRERDRADEELYFARQGDSPLHGCGTRLIDPERPLRTLVRARLPHALSQGLTLERAPRDRDAVRVRADPPSGRHVPPRISRSRRARSWVESESSPT